MTGIKHDDGKAPLDLLPWRALAEVAHVLGHGARKYGRDNWRGLNDERRVLAAALRHAAAHLEGEDIDAESGRAHLAHLVCEGLFALTFTLDRLDERAPEPAEAWPGPRPPPWVKAATLPWVKAAVTLEPAPGLERTWRATLEDGRQVRLLVAPDARLVRGRLFGVVSVYEPGNTYGVVWDTERGFAQYSTHELATPEVEFLCARVLGAARAARDGEIESEP